jgi:hypothetical protein
MKSKTLLLISSLLFSSLIHAQGKFFGGNGDGFATVTLSNVVLPVEIVHFAIAREATMVKADLSILSTESICGITLERSTNGSNYTGVDSLSGILQGSDFAFIDRHPARVDNYYRVRIDRCDGGFVLSKIVLLKAGATPRQFIIADAGIQYSIAGKGVLEIINSTGQIVYKQSLNAGTGRLAIPFLAGGHYFLRFEGQPAGKFLVRQ